VLLAVFAPAFSLSLLRQEIRPQAAQAHSLGRYKQSEKLKNSLSYEANDKKMTAENQIHTWSLVRSYEANDKKMTAENQIHTWSLVRILKNEKT